MTTVNTVHCMRRGAASCEEKPISCRRIVQLAETGFATDVGLDDLDRLSLDELEWEHISRALRDCGNNITRAAEQLGMYRNTLRRKLEKRGLSTTDTRALFVRRT